MFKPIHIVGGGMAGSEAAWQIISAGIPVVLHEMRPKVKLLLISPMTWQNLFVQILLDLTMMN